MLTLSKNGACAFIALGCVFFRGRNVMGIGIGGASQHHIGVRTENTRRNKFGSKSFSRRKHGKLKMKVKPVRDM